MRLVLLQVKDLYQRVDEKSQFLKDIRQNLNPFQCFLLKAVLILITQTVTLFFKQQLFLNFKLKKCQRIFTCIYVYINVYIYISIELFLKEYFVNFLKDCKSQMCPLISLLHLRALLLTLQGQYWFFSVLLCSQPGINASKNS